MSYRGEYNSKHLEAGTMYKHTLAVNTILHLNGQELSRPLFLYVSNAFFLSDNPLGLD